jgi:MFS family permease
MFLVGFFAPCGVTMLSEITPAHLRGRYMSIITLTFAIGQLYGLFIAAFTLESLTKVVSFKIISKG